MNKAELHAVGYPQRSESFFDTIPLTEEIRGLDDQIIECRYVDRQWVFVRQRNDRLHPNGRNAIFSEFICIFHNQPKRHHANQLSFYLRVV